MGNCISKKQIADNDLEEVEGKYAATTSALASREEELARIREELAISRTESETQNARARTLQHHLEQLQKEYETTKGDQCSQIAELKSCLEQAQEEVVAQQRVTAAYIADRDESRNLREGLETKVKKLEQTNARLTTDLATAISDAVANLEAAKRDADQELSEVKALAAIDLDNATETIAASRTDNAELRKELSLTSEHLATATKELTGVQGQVSTLRRRNSTLETELSSTRIILELKEHEASSHFQERKDMDAVRRKLSAVKKDLSDIEQEHKSLQLEYRRLELDLRRRDSFESDNRVTNRFSRTTEPVPFSISRKDVRIKVTEWDRETRVDIREYYPGGPTKKGLSLPVKDAQALANILPEAVREAKKRYKKSAESEINKLPSAAELSHIHLDGEEEEKGPVYDTCDDVRKKINDHLKDSINQTAFARKLSELLPNDSVNQRQLANFLKFKGPRVGAHSPVFYSGYVHFEKLRLHQNKKKSAKREKVEEAWKGEGGLPRQGSHNMHAFCFAGESWSLDQFGQLKLHGAPTGRKGMTMKKPRSR